MKKSRERGIGKIPLLVGPNYFKIMEDQTKLIVVRCAHEDVHRNRCTNQIGYYSKTGMPRADRRRLFCEDHQKMTVIRFLRTGSDNPCLGPYPGCSTVSQPRHGNLYSIFVY